VAFKRGLPEALEIIQRAPTIALPVIVLGELLAGFAVGSQTERNRRELQAFLTSPRAQVLTVDELTTRAAGRAVSPRYEASAGGIGLSMSLFTNILSKRACH
jgi:predicted nucleic acid-binding protein